MSVKIRIGFDKTLHSFDNRRDAFDWVQSQFDSQQVVSVLSYEYGELESLDRYFYQPANNSSDARFIREHIVE